MTNSKPTSRNPWTWVPSLYLAQGLPFAVVNFVSVIMYKSLGVSNADIAFYTAWLYLPWVIKPLWSPVVDILRTRRWWIWAIQLLLGAGFAVVGLTLPLPIFFQASLALFYLVAFSSATHDIAADGYYLLATTEKEQAFFVGIRSTFFRISMIFGQGLLVILAGLIQSHTGLPKVQINVAATPGAAIIQAFDPSSLVTNTIPGDELRVVVQPAEISLAPEPRPKAEIAAVLEAVKSWNTTNNFVRLRQSTRTASQKDETVSWWTRVVSEPFESFLRTRFGRDAAVKSDVAGNIGVVAIQLTKAPGREIVVTPAFSSGDKSVSLAEGSRLVFDDSNWNKPALAVIQLGPEVQTHDSAENHNPTIAFLFWIGFQVKAGGRSI